MSKTKEKKSFVMYDSYMQATQDMSDAEFREAIWKLRDYAIDGKQEKSKSPLVNMFMTMAQPTVDSARNRYEAAKNNGEKGKEHGWKGGRPKKTPEITPEKPQSKPLNVDVDVDENENRDVYVNADAYANGYVEVGDDDKEEDYPDEDWDDEEEEYYDEDEEPLPTSNSTNKTRNYTGIIEPITNNGYNSQGRESQPEKEDIAFSNKPNPILPTNRQELLQCYQENLNLLQQYDANNWEYDSQSKESLKLATSALMKLKNLSFQQAKEHISTVRSQQRRG